jgi:hypothetical protein
MDVAKLIPQVFFDVMARFLPGALVLGTWILLLGTERWAALLTALAGGQLDGPSRLVEMSFTLTLMSFLIGYLISPFAKLVQRLNDARWPPVGSFFERTWEGIERTWDGIALNPDAGAHKANKREIARIKSSKEQDKTYKEARDKLAVYTEWKKDTENFETPKDDSAEKKEVYYDWLRALHPGAGALSAKVRAEFTMYNGLAVAFVLVCAIAVAAQNWVLAAASLVLAPVMAFRGFTTEGTFKKTSRNLYTVLHASDLVRLSVSEGDRRVSAVE